MRWIVTMKFSPVRIEENPAMKIASPAGIDATSRDGVEHQAAGDDVDVPAQQVDAREGKIFRADHHGHEEVAEHSGDGWNQEEEDHHLAVHGEELVVGVGADEISGRREQFETDEEREQAADEEEERDGDTGSSPS